MSTLSLKKVESETLRKIRRERERLAAGDRTAEGSIRDMLAVGAGLAMIVAMVDVTRTVRLIEAKSERIGRGGLAADRLSPGGRVLLTAAETASETDFELENISRIAEQGSLPEAVRELGRQEPSLAPILAGIVVAAKAAAAQTVSASAEAAAKLNAETPVGVRAKANGALLTNHVVTDPAVAEAVRRMKGLRRRIDMAASQAMWAGFHEAVAAVASLPSSLAAVPLWRLRAIDDERVRGQRWGLYPEPHRHIQMSGYVGTIATMKAKRLIPPNGHNCRCTIEPIGLEEATRSKLVVAGSIDAEAVARLNGAREHLIRSGVYPDRGYVR